MKLRHTVLMLLASSILGGSNALCADDATTHFKLANELYMKGNLDGAITEYRAAIRLQPDLESAHANLGSALDDKGDPEGAIAEYREALHLRPDDSHAHNNLAVALLNKGDVDIAIGEVHEALRLEPNYAEAHSCLGSALVAKGDVNGATDEFRKALQLKPNYLPARINIASMLADNGDFDKSVTELEGCLQSAGANFRVFALLDLVQDEKAYAALPGAGKPGLPRHHYTATSHYMRASELRDRGKSDEAIAEFRAALAAMPDYIQAGSDLAQMLEKKHDVDGAIAEYRELLRLRPEMAEVRHKLWVALFEKGLDSHPPNMTAAIDELREVVRRETDDREAREHLGSALEMTGRFREALEQCRFTCRLDKNSPGCPCVVRIEQRLKK